MSANIKLVEGLFERYSVPIDESLIKVLDVKILSRGELVHGKALINLAERKDFIELIKPGRPPIVEIKIASKAKVYRFKKDSGILSEFTDAIAKMSREFFDEVQDPNSDSKYFVQKRELFTSKTLPTWGYKTHRLKDYLRSHLNKCKISVNKFSNRKLHLLIYDLLSLYYPRFFPIYIETVNKKKKLAFDQAKAARITKILNAKPR